MTIRSFKGIRIMHNINKSITSAHFKKYSTLFFNGNSEFTNASLQIVCFDLSTITTISDRRSPFVTLLTPDKKWLNLSRNDALSEGSAEYATVNLTHGRFMGARATINLWNPAVVYPEVSFSQIWLEAGPEESLNTVETGWLVDTVSYPRNQAKMFTFYTGSRYAPNNLLLPVSIYDGPQVEITIAIWKDQVTGDWWLRIQDENVGYWHKDLFTHLKGLQKQFIGVER
ncbi:uncharacterized protein LOC104422293 [Eucalyptus grandis]|uniref:uncharacterized protein LOC104422293 n=1 Tax=Eucalyptus grandis TaxID=71139 RepID=UPI00192F0BAA|nr:uncharacterized protein LOC104422293 [Eucalyptus grandis]